MARRVETELREAISGDLSSLNRISLIELDDEPQALIDVAMRKRAEAEGDRLEPAHQPSTRRRKRAAKPQRAPTHSDVPTPGGSALDGVPSGPSGWFTHTGVQPWSAVAIIAAAALILPFVVVDMAFFSANLLKLLEGAWVPLLFGAAVAVMIWTWRRGAAILIAKTWRIEVPLTDLIRSLEKRPPHIVKGTAVFLHEHNVILTIETAQTPRVDLADRVKMESISDKFSTVRLRFGFMESPNVPKALVIARKLGWQFDIMATSFFVSRRSLKPSAQSGMPQWQDHLFIAMSRSANDATDYFQIPTGRVVEVGTQVTI